MRDNAGVTIPGRHRQGRLRQEIARLRQEINVLIRHRRMHSPHRRLETGTNLSRRQRPTAIVHPHTSATRAGASIAPAGTCTVVSRWPLVLYIVIRYIDESPAA